MTYSLSQCITASGPLSRPTAMEEHLQNLSYEELTWKVTYRYVYSEM